MLYKTITYREDGGVAIITMNRPRRLNAMNELMWGELTELLDRQAREDNIRVVVLTGAGRAFSAGADLRGDEEGEKLVVQASPLTMRQGVRYGPQEIVRRLYYMEKPTIAMVNGDAVGAGFDWALACDLRLGSEKARFMVAFTRIGLVPGAGGAWLMSRRLGMAKAAEYIFSGDFISAQEAERLGILNRLVPSERLEEETLAVARRLAHNPPVALKLDKMLLRKAQETDLDTALEMAAACQAICVTTEDHQEGVAAFREKREPVFRGR